MLIMLLTNRNGDGVTERSHDEFGDITDSDPDKLTASHGSRCYDTTQSPTDGFEWIGSHGTRVSRYHY
jgi:hypothetical protein